jgi:hypothetical protein
MALEEYRHVHMVHFLQGGLGRGRSTGRARLGQYARHGGARPDGGRLSQNDRADFRRIFSGPLENQ